MSGAEAHRPKRVEGVSTRDLPDGECVALPPDGRAAIVLNATGAAVLELCDGTRGADAIAALLRAQFPDVPAARIEADVATLIDELVDAGCVRR